jgi:uncharacterized Ntn-hydrolase superfamily protein
MIVRRTICGLLLMTLCCRAPLAALAADEFVQPRRPVATYSIVARDSVTGQLGVAVQSHWFSVGALVPWAESGVGAVATQSFVEPSYGHLGLELMRTGRNAQASLDALVTTDAGKDVRQVAMIDATGRVAAHTGSLCIREAGHHIGAQYSVQANLMENGTVWDAMARAYETATGDLADRLFDLRVEDNPDPVTELGRLVKLQRAYQKLNEGDELWAAGQVKGALAAYSSAGRVVPDEATNGEAVFWIGITLASSGDAEKALPYLRRAYAQDERWAELVARLPASGLLPDDRELINTLVEGMKK